jgi:hypothetical protein
MPARIDLDIDERPRAIIQRAYDADYILGLGRQFKFDPKDLEIATRIYMMGAAYLIARRQDNSEDLPLLNKRLHKFDREIDLFRQALDKAADLDLPTMMYFSALELNQPPPGRAFPGLTQHQREQSGEPYLREFMRILDILAHAVQNDKKRSASKRGPRVNSGLEIIARQAAQFFAVELKDRPFTIDPHKPFKATPAFDFVKALVAPLDDVTDNEIVTAIRGAKPSKKVPNRKSKN